MSIGQGSYYRGWASDQFKLDSTGKSQEIFDVLLGQVLSIEYEGNDAGKVRVRLIGSLKDTSDDNVSTVAYPANINSLKYPLPGEVVVIVQGTRNEFANSKPILVYYYIATLTTRGSVTFNSDPYIGNIVPVNGAEKVFTPQYTHRFESKIRSLESFIKKDSAGDVVKDRPTSKPYEGDFILQSRFGSTIRLGSTVLNQKNQWSDKGGIAGDPIVVLTTSRNINESTLIEDIDKSEASFYVCSTQTLPVEIATSNLLSHLYEET